MSAIGVRTARPRRSADIPVGFTGAEFLISFMLPFAPIKADLAARLCKGRQVRAPAASFYCSAFFRIIRLSACLSAVPSPLPAQADDAQAGLFGGQPAFARTPGKFWQREKQGLDSSDRM